MTHGLTFFIIAVIIYIARVVVGGEDWYDAMVGHHHYDWGDDFMGYFRAACLCVFVCLTVGFCSLFSPSSPSCAESTAVSAVAEAPVKQQHKRLHKHKAHRKHKKVSHSIKH